MPLPEPCISADRYQKLHAGPLAMLFDHYTGGLRNIDCRQVSVWRELLVLVRDARWQTVPTKLVEVQSRVEERRFAIDFWAETINSSIRFDWRASIHGDEKGVIDYRFTGRATSTFEANRIGFCLMHPAEICAGQAIRQHRVDGSIIEGHFPCLIEPQIVGQYSIRNLRGIEHEFIPQVWACAEFEGEVFETEDQRNWSDASFKTYGTPLERSFPVVFRVGDRREQAVRLSIGPTESACDANFSEPVARVVTPSKSLNEQPNRGESAGNVATPQPEFGLMLCAAGTDFPKRHQESLKRVCKLLAVDTLRYDLVLPPQFDRQLSVFARLPPLVATVTDAGCKLELALQLPVSGEVRWRELGRRLLDCSAAIQRLLVYRRGAPTTRLDDLQNVRRAAPKLSFPIGGGSDAHFCELNRDQTLGYVPLEEMDFISWSLCPMVHADDDLTFLENVRSLQAMLRTARRFAPYKPLIVSPISLKPRFNAVADELDRSSVEVPLTDPRQLLEVAATWTRRVWTELSGGGVESITWYEVFGERGIAQAPDSIPPIPRLFPVGEALKKRAEPAGWE